MFFFYGKTFFFSPKIMAQPSKKNVTDFEILVSGLVRTIQIAQNAKVFLEIIKIESKNLP